MPSPIKQKITEDMKTAMKAQDKPRLAAIRLILAAIKQREVDERIELDDSHVITILDKEAKKRRESLQHYEKANRQDLVDQENLELNIILSYLPKALDPSEINKLIDQAMAETGASGMQDMGKVMASLKPKLQGRADMTVVSQIIKDKLSGSK